MYAYIYIHTYTYIYIWYCAFRVLLHCWSEHCCRDAARFKAALTGSQDIDVLLEIGFNMFQSFGSTWATGKHMKNTWKRSHHLLSSAGASDLIGACRSMTVNTSSAMAWSPASPRVVDTPTVVPWQCAGLETSTPWDKIWSLNLYLTYLAFCSFLRCVVPIV